MKTLLGCGCWYISIDGNYHCDDGTACYKCPKEKCGINHWMALGSFEYWLHRHAGYGNKQFKKEAFEALSSSFFNLIKG